MAPLPKPLHFVTASHPLTPHRKKSFSIFPSPAGMALTKLSLGGNNDVIYNLFPSRESLVSDIPAGDGNIEKLFLRCSERKHRQDNEDTTFTSFSPLFVEGRLLP